MAVSVRRKPRVKTKSSKKKALDEAAKNYRTAIERTREFRLQCEEVISRLTALEEEEALALKQLETCALESVGRKTVRLHGLKLYQTAKRGNRKVDAQKLLAAHPKIWTTDGLVSVTVGAFDRIVASGVVPKDEAETYISRGKETQQVHIEEE